MSLADCRRDAVELGEMTGGCHERPGMTDSADASGAG